jgi:hypothetical protein
MVDPGELINQSQRLQLLASAIHPNNNDDVSVEITVKEAPSGANSAAAILLDPWVAIGDYLALAVIAAISIPTYRTENGVLRLNVKTTKLRIVSRRLFRRNAVQDIINMRELYDEAERVLKEEGIQSVYRPA